MPEAGEAGERRGSGLGGLCIIGLGGVLAMAQELGRLVEHRDPPLALHLGRSRQVQLAHVRGALVRVRVRAWGSC